MRCNKCNVKFKVIDVKEDKSSNGVVRQYRCPKCKMIIYTWEETCPSTRYRIARSEYDYKRRRKNGTQ